MEVSETCTICNKPNDQMLMLSCVHDPCINCAATAYAEQIHIKAQSKEIYVCEICGEETLLDNTTIMELTALANAVVKMPSKVKQQPSTYQKKKQTQVPATYVSPTPQHSQKKVIYYCKDHSEEEISYYCFSCWTNICPECAIHGSHKDHDVKLIKKAISQVKNQYMDIVGKVGDNQNGMTKMKDNFLRMIKQTNQRHVRDKNLVSREFDIIRTSLQAKEKELIKELDDINKQNIATLTSFLETINSTYEEANKIKRTVQHITKKDEVLILEDYKKISQLEDSLKQLMKSTDSISGEKNHLNGEFYQQQCKEIADSIANVKVNIRSEQIGRMSKEKGVIHHAHDSLN